MGGNSKEPSKKELEARRKATELQDSKLMNYEVIVQNIANAKKAISHIQGEINILVKRRQEQEALVSKMNRILRLKKQSAGA